MLVEIGLLYTDKRNHFTFFTVISEQIDSKLVNSRDFILLWIIPFLEYSTIPLPKFVLSHHVGVLYSLIRNWEVGKD